MGNKMLVIALNKKHKWTSTEDTKVIYDLKGCTDWAKRASVVLIDTPTLTKKLRNYIIAFELGGIDDVRLIHHTGLFDTYESIYSQLDFAITNRATEKEMYNERVRAKKIINEFAIPLEVVANIDDYLNTELLSAYDVEIGQTLYSCEKRNTYTPTDLQRKEWNVPKGYAFSHTDRLKEIRQATLADKLTAYATLQYYIANGLDSAEYNESKTGNITRKALKYAMTECGHADLIPPEDPTQTFIDTYRLYMTMY